MGIFYNKGLTMILLMGSVFLFSIVVMNVLSKAFESYQEKYVTKSMNDLSDMFLFIDGRQVLILNICVTALFIILGLLFLGIVYTVVLAIFGFFAPNMLIKMFRKRRIKKFNVQLVDSLTAMSNAFKAGLSFPQAMEHVSQSADPPLSQEYGVFVREMKLGVPLDEGLQSIAERVGCDDMHLVVTATTICRQLGGNMAEMFDTIAVTIRERFRLEGKIDALTSQGRMQGWVVAAMPLLLGVVLNWMRPDLMQPMFEHWFGYVVIGVIAILELLGIFLIRRIVNINV